MKVSELAEHTSGDATADYEVVVEQPGVFIGKGNAKTPLWVVGEIRRDTHNKRITLVPTELLERPKE